MANYTVIGGDGKQYGPIPEGDLRKWIAEGRLNGQSLVKADTDLDFRPLATFPEISDAFAPPPLAPGMAPAGYAPLLGTPAGIDRKSAEDKVKVPAIGLMVSAILSFVLSLYSLVTIGNIKEEMRQFDAIFSQINPQTQQFIDTFAKLFSGPFGIAQYCFMMLISALIFFGAFKMLKLQSYEFSYAAAIAAVIPCFTPCCGWILGLIFGFWAMSALTKAKPHFS